LVSSVTAAANLSRLLDTRRCELREKALAELPVLVNHLQRHDK
jgi:hypothetical protein